MKPDDEHISKTKDFIKAELSGEVTGHDYWHSIRVWQNAIYIMNNENLECNHQIVQLAALLHDVEDWKFVKKENGVINKWLHNLNLHLSDIEYIENIISNISFKGIEVENNIICNEGRIVQDADRLDALGSIGIARAFAYGGFKNREIYIPDEKPVSHKSFFEYKNSNSCTINHFYEKLLTLKDRMNTETGKKLADQRHKIMEDFLTNFFNEWNFK